MAAWPLAAERHQRGDLTVVDGEAGEGERVKEGAEKVEEEEEGTQQELTVTDDDQADRQTDIDLGLRNAAESGAVSAAAAFFGLSQSPPLSFPLSLYHTPAVSVFLLSTFFFDNCMMHCPSGPKWVKGFAAATCGFTSFVSAPRPAAAAAAAGFATCSTIAVSTLS